MTAFYKRETLIKTISFMSFFVAINVVCSFLTTIIPLVSLVLIIFLPLTSAVVEVLCKDRWFPIYALATIGLSIVVSLSSIDFTIFYVVPSIFTGYIFGLFAKKNLPSMFAVFFASIIQTILSFAFIPLLKLITGQNLLDVIAKIFGISDRFWFDTLILLVLFLVALIQIILSFIVVKNELEKFGQKSEWKLDQIQLSNYSTLISVILAVAFAFFYLPASYLFMGISYYFVTFIIASHFKLNLKAILVIDGICFLIGLILYAALNQFLKEGVDFILFIIPAGLISLVSICYSFLKKSLQ